MRVLITIASLCFCLVVLARTSSQSRGWRGIVPLHSTRTDVERIMGIPTEKLSEYSDFYKTGKETVVITYAQGLPCGVGEKYSQWRVSRNTVEGILVTPTVPLRISDLGIDESKYDKRQGGHRADDLYYINEQTGETLTVFMDEVRSISYSPGTLDKDLRCPDLPTNSDVKCEGLTPPRFSFFHNVAVEREKLLLDNFSIALKDQPTGTGYIIVYAGKRARMREAKVSAQRAKKYLVKERSVNPNHLKTIDGGYREQFEVELYLVPEGICPPTAAPTIDPRDVQIVKAARSRSQRE